VVHGCSCGAASGVSEILASDAAAAKGEEMKTEREILNEVFQWMRNAIPESRYGIEVTDEYKVQVYNALRDSLYNIEEMRIT
jgi:stalled ribosome rescue protein Dom34